MSIDISNESGIESSNAALVRLATFALDQLRNPSTGRTFDPARRREGTMSAYHEKYLASQVRPTY